MELQNFIDKRQKLYEELLTFIENDEINQDNFRRLIDHIKIQKIPDDPEVFKSFINLINIISKNHHRNSQFLNKIEQILTYFSENIKQTYSNDELCDVFIKNKRIIFFLLENKMITIDKQKYSDIINEIGLLEMIENYEKDEFKTKMRIGENDYYICQLIRQDLIDKFIPYIYQNNISLTSQILPSKFETNSLLLKEKVTLIEYAAFFGSIQIIKYLKNKNVELTPSLWIYSIHSNNAELIDLLEDNCVPPPNDSYEICLKESIKCHHNEIAQYIKDNYAIDPILIKKYDKNILSYSFKYRNYWGFSDELNHKLSFFYLCQYNYIEIVKLLLKNVNVNRYFIRYKYNDKTFFNITALYLAAENGNQGIINILLSKKGIRLTFSGSRIQKVDIPSPVISIDSFSFSYCHLLTQVSIASSVTSIGEYAFLKCESLRQINIPSSVTSIDECAFGECKSLKQIYIPTSVTSIGKYVFSRCYSLKHISIPPYDTSIPQGAFCECMSLNQISFSSPENDSLGTASMENSDPLFVQITIPSFIKTIPTSSFCNCHLIEQMIIPLSVTKIGNSAFEGCISLTQIFISPSVTKIGENAFEGCTSLIQVFIPSSVSFIGSYAFCGCNSLEHIVMPSSITEINEGLFSNCSSLLYIKIPSSVTIIHKQSFSECSSLKEITLPPSIEFIEENAFKNCSSLTDIFGNLGDMKIDKSAFDGCESLKSIPPHQLLSNSIDGEYNDVVCYDAYYLEMKEEMERQFITSARLIPFFVYPSLTHITLPESVNSIGNYAFNGCLLLKQITIPSSVISIDTFSFSGCPSLEQLLIPSSLLIESIEIEPKIIITKF